MRLEVERPSLQHEPVVQVDAVDGALTDASFRVRGVISETDAFDGTRRDKFLQLFPCATTARVKFAVFIEAVLIDLGCVDSIQAVRLTFDADCVGVLGMSRHGGYQ
jgi:hypothetical protein